MTRYITDRAHGTYLAVTEAQWRDGLTSLLWVDDISVATRWVQGAYSPLPMMSIIALLRGRGIDATTYEIPDDSGISVDGPGAIG